MLQDKALEVVKLWFNALFSPKITFKKEKKNASIKTGIQYIIIAALVSSLVLGFLISFVPFFSYLKKAFILSNMGVSTQFAFILMPITSVVSVFVFSFAITGVIYLTAKMFKAKKGFKELFYFMALYTSAFQLINLATTLLKLDILILLLSFYALYPLTMAVKEAYSLSTAKAVFSWLIPFIIIVLLFGVVTFILMYPSLVVSTANANECYEETGNMFYCQTKHMKFAGQYVNFCEATKDEVMKNECYDLLLADTELVKSAPILCEQVKDASIKNKCSEIIK